MYFILFCKQISRVQYLHLQVAGVGSYMCRGVSGPINKWQRGCGQQAIPFITGSLSQILSWYHRNKHSQWPLTAACHATRLQGWPTSPHIQLEVCGTPSAWIKATLDKVTNWQQRHHYRPHMAHQLAIPVLHLELIVFKEGETEPLQRERKVSTADTKEIKTDMGPLLNMYVPDMPLHSDARACHRQALHRHTCLCEPTVR